MPPNRFESEVESFLEGSHGDRTHIKRADHHTVTPLCGTLLLNTSCRGDFSFKTLVFPCPVCDIFRPARSDGGRERDKVRPAHEKWPKNGGLWRAGRVFSRKCRWRGCAGRSFSRKRCWKGCAGRTLSRASSRRILPCEFVVPRWRPRPAPRSRACPHP